MKLLIKFFSCLFLTTLSFSTYAQSSLGFEVGTNLSAIHQNYENEEEESDISAKLGFKIGAFADLPITETFSIRPGIYYTTKGSKIESRETVGSFDDFDERIETNVRLSYLEVPINAVVKVNNFEFSAGPAISFGLGGNAKWSYESNIFGNTFTDSGELDVVFKQEADDPSEDVQFRFLNLGYQLGIGYHAGPILVKASFTKDLTNMNIPSSSDAQQDFDVSDYRDTNMVFGLSAAYTLKF